MKNSIFDTPEGFFNTIPTEVQENITFRQTLHEKISKDTKLQRVFLQMVLACPQIGFNTSFWVYEARNSAGLRNLPFILRPAQIDALDALKDAIDNRHDLIIDKSRDEGATELICKLFILYWLLVPDTTFLVGSRKEELVDKTGDHKALFSKMLYAVSHLPTWMQPKIVEKTFRHLRNPDTNSSIDGEATNENFGAGDRRTAIMVDELGRIDYKIAQCIIENLSDTSDCNIFNSTHFYGTGHPYNKLLRSGKLPVVVLPWERNPNKNKGMYRSPDYGCIEIKDLDYYKDICPKVFKKIGVLETIKVSDLNKELLVKYPAKLQQINFIADGGEKNEGGWRSIWYDKEEAERSSRRDVAQNIDRSPMGAGDQFFDPGVLRRIRLDYIRPPECRGEVVYKVDETGKIKDFSIKFVENFGKERLQWWGELIDERPNQNHNYVVACDISLGTGSSNSVAGIYDVNERTKVGSWICPNTPPEEFADQSVAICKWVGGETRKAFLIWEASGVGESFGKRVIRQNYAFAYTTTDESTKRRKKKKTWGWYSSKSKKYNLLLELRIALAEGVKSHRRHKSLTVYDDKTLTEYETYIVDENGELILASQKDETSGAKAGLLMEIGLYLMVYLYWLFLTNLRL
jgi:hypothetical protein